MTKFFLYAFCLFAFTSCTGSETETTNSQNKFDPEVAIENHHLIKEMKVYRDAKDFHKVDSMFVSISKLPEHNLSARAFWMRDSLIKENPELYADYSLPKKLAQEKESLENISTYLKTAFPKVGGPIEEAKSIESWHTIINNAITSRSEVNIELAKELDKKFRIYRSKRFYEIRKEFVDKADKSLWEDDMDVTISGKRNEEITFISAKLAANANIKEFHNNISSTLSSLGFKRVNYKWYEYEDGYTYYTLN